jgi:hypothetical protein
MEICNIKNKNAKYANICNKSYFANSYTFSSIYGDEMEKFKHPLFG